MGCISSTQHELGNDVNIHPNIDADIAESDNNNNNVPRLQSIESQSNHDNLPGNNPLNPAYIDPPHIDSPHIDSPYIDPPKPSIQATESLRHERWTTDDVISYICSIEDAKFCDEKYDIFKAGLQSLGINGKTINVLCYDPNILKDLGLNDENDILLIQNAFIILYANNEYFTYNDDVKKDIDNKDNENLHENDEFFPLHWKFPLEDSEKIRNHYYVGQSLLITSKHLHPIPSKCIYVENNWIVIKYKDINKSNTNLLPPTQQINELSLSTKSTDTNDSNSILPSPTNHDNIYKNMEKIHIIKEKVRISKINNNNNNNNNNNKQEISGVIDKSDNNNNNNIFEKEYYGLSYQYSSTSIVGNIVPPDCYIDPITYEIMKDPVTSKTSGRTYDRSMIMEHFENYGTDPFNQQPMTKNDLYDNKDLKRAIDRWLKNNPELNTME